jgi:hypothetical protein
MYCCEYVKLQFYYYYYNYTAGNAPYVSQIKFGEMVGTVQSHEHSVETIYHKNEFFCCSKIAQKSSVNAVAAPAVGLKGSSTPQFWPKPPPRLSSSLDTLNLKPL